MHIRKMMHGVEDFFGSLGVFLVCAYHKGFLIRFGLDLMQNDLVWHM